MPQNTATDHRSSFAERIELAEVTLGKRPPDHIYAAGTLLNVFTKSWQVGDIWVYRGCIAKITREPCPFEVDTTRLEGTWVVPGFVEGHVHIESSLLAPESYAEMVLDFGVTTVITDLHEVAAVSGRAGIEACLEAFAGTRLKVFLVSPLKMPFLPAFERPLAQLALGDIEALLETPYTLGVNEIHGHETAALLAEDMPYMNAAYERQKGLEGHLFHTRGDALDACLALGVVSDHEPRARDEVVEKLEKGLFVMLRQGSLAREVETLVGAVTEANLPTDRMALVTDDILPNDVMSQRYMLHKVRLAVQAGIPLIDALRMVSYNPALHYGIADRVGALRIGAHADMVVLSDLDELTLERVIVSGEPWQGGGGKAFSYPPSMLRSVPLARVSAKDFAKALPSFLGEHQRQLKAIRLDLTTRFTDLVPREVPVRDGVPVLPGDQDLLWIACVHRSGDRIGMGVLDGYGLKGASVGVSIAHDHHNLVVIGKTFDDLAATTNGLLERQGGIVVMEGDAALAELPLPVAGLMAQAPYKEVAARVETLHRTLHGHGVNWPVPLFFLFFLAMPAAPHYRITDSGVIRTAEQKLVDIWEV